jgi:hypothetical protein
LRFPAVGFCSIKRSWNWRTGAARVAGDLQRFKEFIETNSWVSIRTPQLKTTPNKANDEPNHAPLSSPVSRNLQDATNEKNLGVRPSRYGAAQIEEIGKREQKIMKRTIQTKDRMVMFRTVRVPPCC